MRERAPESAWARWAKRHPGEAVVGAFVLGFVTGTSPELRGALRDAALALLLRC